MDNQLQKYIKDNYIPKKVIEDKIEELEHNLFIQEQLGINKDERTEKQVDILKEILQENMEEENYNHIPRID